MLEIMLQKLDEEYLGKIITAMSFEVRAFLVTLLRQGEFQGDLDLERLAQAAEISGKGYTKANFRVHLQNALGTFVDKRTLEPEGKQTQSRCGYKLNRAGYDDLVPAVDVAYDITERFITVDGVEENNILKRSMPYMLGKFKNPLVLTKLANIFSREVPTFERDVVAELREEGIPRPTLHAQLGLLEECGILVRSKETVQVEYAECERHERHTHRKKRTAITLTEAGQEVFRYLRDLKLFVRADPEFFPRDDRIETLRGNYPIDNRKRILYVSANGDRTEDIVAKIKNLDWNIDIYRMLLRVERVDVKEFRQMQPKRLGGYDLVVLDGFCGCEDARSMASTYNTLKSQQGSNGTAAILLTPNETLGDNIERESPINYIFITDNHGNLDVRKLQEIMYKLMANQKSVKKAQFYCK